MSIRRLAIKGFSLHNILGTGDDVEVGESHNSPDNGPDNGRLFDFRGRLADQRDHRDQRDQRDQREVEPPLGPLRLKVNMARVETQSDVHPTPTASNGISTHRVMMLERQLNEAKERMQMLNQDRTARVRKAEEQARKALAEERSTRSQLDHIKAVHAQHISDLNRDLRAAEADAKQLHGAYTNNDALQADNQSLKDANESLTAESAHQQLTINRMTVEATQFASTKQRFDGDNLHVKQENESLINQIATITADATRKQHDLQTQNCASRVELETLKRVNVDLNRQISTLDQELVRVRSESLGVGNGGDSAGSAGSAESNSQLDDLMEVIKQLQLELVQKDARYDQLQQLHQLQLKTQKQTIQGPSSSSRVSVPQLTSSL